MSALNNQTNRNGSRYFFATSENGEQTLDLQYGTTGGAVNLSTMAVTISGPAGNGVIVNQAPQFVASEFVLGDQAVIGGSASSYFTPSTLTSNFVGFNLSTDRLPGSGITTIEAYSGNGLYNGFEFCGRGVNSVLFSTNSAAINEVLKNDLGREGALASLNAAGTFTTSAIFADQHTSISSPPGGQGRQCYTIEDLSGIQTLNRWSMGTTNATTGGNAGSDFSLFAYDDQGQFVATPLNIRRSDGAMQIANISSIQNFGGVSSAAVFPASKTNVEFGAPGNHVVTIAGASNQATPFVPLFSTPITGLNPNTQTLISLNFTTAMSSGATLVNYKVGFSTATAYTNLLTTSYCPGGIWTPSAVPGPSTPTGYVMLTGACDSDGINPDGTANLYVLGQLSDPTAPADLIYVNKGVVTESTKNALVWRPL